MSDLQFGIGIFAVGAVAFILPLCRVLFPPAEDLNAQSDEESRRLDDEAAAAAERAQISRVDPAITRRAEKAARGEKEMTELQASAPCDRSQARVQLEYAISESLKTARAEEAIRELERMRRRKRGLEDKAFWEAARDRTPEMEEDLLAADGEGSDSSYHLLERDTAQP